jgi:hypothetical protein
MGYARLSAPPRMAANRIAGIVLESELTTYNNLSAQLHLGDEAHAPRSPKGEIAMEQEPLTVQYTNLLHQHQAPNAPEVREFRLKNKEDKVFLQRARKLDAIFLMRKVSRPS